MVPNKEKIYSILKDAYINEMSFWAIVELLKKEGFKSERAKRMANKALKGIFMWEGKKTSMKE